MIVTLSNAGLRHQIDVPNGSTLGYIRSRTHDLEEVGAPSSYNFTVNGSQQDDGYRLITGDTVGFRPITGSKGSNETDQTENG